MLNSYVTLAFLEVLARFGHLPNTASNTSGRGLAIVLGVQESREKGMPVSAALRGSSCVAAGTSGI